MSEEGNSNNIFTSGLGNNFLDLLSMGSSRKNQNFSSAEKFSTVLTEDNFGSGSFKIRSKLNEIRDITEVKSNKLKMNSPKKGGIRLGFDSESESQATTT